MNNELLTIYELLATDNCRLSTVLRRLQSVVCFKENKPNLLDAQMNLSSVKTMNYEQITMNNANKNKANTKPIRANLLDAQMNLSSVKTMNYEQITMNNANKNKPNQSQFAGCSNEPKFC